MKSEFQDYLEALDMPKAIEARVEAIHSFYEWISGLPIDQMFVTDRVDSEGNRIFESLWFFTTSHAMEAHDFISTDSFDVGVVKELLIWRVDKSEYDLVNAIPASRMLVAFNTDYISGELTASGNNCNYLRDLLVGWLVPRTADLAVS